MARSNVNSTTKSADSGRDKRARAPKEVAETHPASDGAEEGGTQTRQVEEEEIAESIESTRSKLAKLQGHNDAMEQWAQGFFDLQQENKDKIGAELDEAQASITEKKQSHEEQLLEQLCAALSPVGPGTHPAQLSKPLDHTQIAQVLAAEQPLSQLSQIILDEAFELINVYSHLTGSKADPMPLQQLEVTFRRECEDIPNMFAVGKKLVKSDIENMLADRYNKVRGRRALTEDEARLGKFLFGNADQNDDMVMSDGEGWGEVAWRTSRAVRRMPVRTVAIRDGESGQGV